MEAAFEARDADGSPTPPRACAGRSKRVCYGSAEEGSVAMSEKPSRPLHLPSLSISGFRGIRALEIPRLGRVTLLAGRNGVGKTATLEAVRLYASRGREQVFSTLSHSHEEFASAVDDDGDERIMPDFAALFHGRDVSPESRIEIGPRNGSNDDSLKIEAIAPNRKLAERLKKLGRSAVLDLPLVIQVSFASRKRQIPWFFLTYADDGRHGGIGFYRGLVDDQDPLPAAMNCRSLGPGLPSNEEVTELWDEIALTDDEDRAVQALNLVLDDEADRVAMIGEGYGHYRRRGRRVVVKLRNRDRPVPLRSLGDGAARMFGVALALAGSRGGFLVIDEVENGIHHSVHDKFWRMILRTAEENDVQVFAATHSFNCVQGFARAAADSPESEAVLARLERSDEHTRAVLYSKQEIETAAEQGIEVR